MLCGVGDHIQIVSKGVQRETDASEVLPLILQDPNCGVGKPEKKDSDINQIPNVVMNRWRSRWARSFWRGPSLPFAERNMLLLSPVGFKGSLPLLDIVCYFSPRDVVANGGLGWFERNKPNEKMPIFRGRPVF